MSSRPLLPPRGLFVGTRLLFDAELPATVKETLLQLMAFAWGSAGHTTPPLSYALLERLTGKNARTLRGHLALLKNFDAALRLQYLEQGLFIVSLAGWLFTNQPGAGGKNLPEPVKEDDSFQNLEIQEDELNINPVVLPVFNDSDQERPKTAANPGNRVEKEQAPEPKPLSRALQKRLGEAGVFPSLLAEVAERAQRGAYSESDLRALLAWCAEDQPDRPAALFIGRLRAGARAAKIYKQPPCPRCGLRGRHTQECPHRYAMD